MLCVLESPFSPLPHCVPAAHSFLLEVLLLVPSPRLLLGVIISPHCCCEKDASICTKQDSSGPMSLGIKDPWNNKKQCLPDSDSTRGLFQSFPLCSLRVSVLPHLADLFCCFQGTSMISSCPSHGPVQCSPLPFPPTLASWLWVFGSGFWSLLIGDGFCFVLPKSPLKWAGGCPPAHSLIYSSNIYALSRGWKFKRI